MDGVPATNRLRALRRSAKLDLADIAKACAVSISTAWEWENGNAIPRADKVKPLAEVLGITTGEVLEMFEADAEVAI